MKEVTLLLLLVQISILRNLQLITLIDNNIKSTQILSKSGQTQETNNNVKSSVSGNPNSSALVDTRLQQILAQNQTAKQAQAKDQTKQKEDSKNSSINNISLQKINATPVLHVTQTNSTQIKQIVGQSNIHQNTTKFSVPNSIILLTVKFQQKNGSNVTKVNQTQQTHSLANTTLTNQSLQATTDRQNEQLTTLELQKQVSVNGTDTEKTVENVSASATITNSSESSVIKTLHASVSSQDAKAESSSKTTTKNNSSTTTNSSNSTSASQVARNSSTTVPKRKIPSPTPAKPKVVTPPKRKEDPLKTLGSAAKMQDTGLSDDLIPEGLEKDPRFKRIKNLTVATTIPKQILDLKNIKRSFNGSGNNLEHPNWGLSNTSQTRHCKVNYADGKQTPVADLPSPRQVSDAVGSVREQPQLDPQNLTLAWTIWGQFLDHDIQFSPSSSDQNQSFHIIIPKCDSFFDSDCNGGRVIPFTRSLFSLTEQGVRVPFNSLTAWIDASMVYGSNQNQTKKLRSFKGGKLRTDFSGRMLPEGKPVNSTQKNISNMTMEAGDARSNQNLILLSYQTLFLREHNRICDLLLSNFNNMVDEDIFQIARNYIIGLIQKITYDDYLPILLGPTAYQQFIGQYKGYNDKMNPTIQVQFSGAAFRFGHSLIPVAFPLVNLYGDKIQILDMDRAFFRPDLLDSFAVDRVFRGASRTITKLRDGQFVDQLRNLLILAPQIRNIRMDLLSLNIQRGRDQGLPAYNDMRQCYGLPKFKDFNQLSDDPIKNEDLANVYNNDIQKVDSYIAIQIQKGIKGSVLGQTGIAMVGRQFQKIRDGDRFWYERVYPEKIIEQIKATKLSHIIMRNTFISELQEDVFHYHFGG